MVIFEDKKVLVFDECKFMANLLHTMLLAFDVGQVIVCTTIKEAKYNLKHNSFDCVFCDWSAWPEPKLECLKYIRSPDNIEDPSVPVIICTGFTTLPQILIARDHGCNEIITKPIAPSNVFDKLYSALDNTREFILNDSYAGPDRRRKKDEYSGEERRADRRLPQTEIDNVLSEKQHE